MPETEIVKLRDKAREWQRIASREDGRLRATYQKMADIYSRMADDLGNATHGKQAGAPPCLSTTAMPI